MNFTDSTQAPVTIFVGGAAVAVPRFTRRDWRLWSSQVDAERLDEASKGLTGEERFKFVVYYSVPPTSPREMRERIGTYPGQDFIIRTSLKKVGPEWTDERVDQFIDANADADIELLAFQLASLQQNQPAPRAAAAQPPAPDGASADDEDAEGEQRQDPQQPPPAAAAMAAAGTD